MNVKQVFSLLYRSRRIVNLYRLSTPFDHGSHYQPVVMQKSLLSFFKPLSEKSQISNEGPTKKDEKSEKSPEETPKKLTLSSLSAKRTPASQKKPRNGKKSSQSSSKKLTPKEKSSPPVVKKKSTEQNEGNSPTSVQKKEKSPQRSPKTPLKTEENSPIVSKKRKDEKSPKKEPIKNEKNSPIVQKKQKGGKSKKSTENEENSPIVKKKRKKETSPKKLIQKEETSPIVQKKRKRIAALLSDSEDEDLNTSSKHEKKKVAVSKETDDEEKKASGSSGTDDEEEKKAAASGGSDDEEKEDEDHVKSETDGEEEEKSASPESDKKSNSKKKQTLATIKLGGKGRKGNSDKKSKPAAKKKAAATPTSKADAKEEKLDIVWKHGEKTPYLSLAKTLQKVEETSARLKIIDILADYFRNVILSNKADLLPSIYLCLNTLGPAYEGLELGIADTYLMKAVAQCTGRSMAQIKADAAKTGDLGIVAEQSRSNQKLMFRPAALTVQGVYHQLSEIAKISGQNAIKKKIDKIQGLFVSCKECEARFIIRSLAGKLRIGLAEQSVLQALALACTTTPPNQSDPPEITDASKTMSSGEFKKIADEEALILKTTYCECPNYNLIVPALLEHGVRELPKHCKITPGLPVKPMLAQPTKGVHEVFQRFENIKFTCEWKYDGERAQIHVLEDGSIKIYSRNQEDNTSKYPDVIDDLRQTFKPELKSCIIDAEAVAWDREQKKIMPFQILSTRKRKDADVSEIKVRVCVFLFDLLYVNGQSLTQKPLAERRDLLKEHFQEVEEKFKFVTSMDTNSMEEVHEFLDESVKGNCEGLMVKTLETEATYEIAKRSRNWLKLKKDYLEGCGDTLDLVVIGGYIGKGKRTGQYGGFLLASYDADNDEYQTICKIGTGFTEEALATHSEFLKQHIIEKAKPYYRYDSSHEPDHWFDAVQVWEVKCADLSLSPIYYSAIGQVDSDKGISLRFPRFLRIREDKTVEQATSSAQVAELYKNQDQIKNNASNNESKFNEEDF